MAWAGIHRDILIRDYWPAPLPTVGVHRSSGGLPGATRREPFTYQNPARNAKRPRSPKATGLTGIGGDDQFTVKMFDVARTCFSGMMPGNSIVQTVRTW